MVSQAVLVVLDDYYSVMNRHDVDGIGDVVADDLVLHNDLVPDHIVRGSGEFRDMFANLWKAVPDLTFEELHDPFFADGAPQCAVHGRMTGTLVNEFPAFGWTRVGGFIEIEYMAVYEMALDRISHIRLCLNPAIAARQVGNPTIAAHEANAA
jgi:SnoaL-like domain